MIKSSVVDEKTLDKRVKIRLIIMACAFVIALVAFLAAFGVLGYVFTGKDAFLNESLYLRKVYVYYKDYVVEGTRQEFKEPDFSFTAAIDSAAGTLTLETSFDHSFYGGKIVSVKPFGEDQALYRTKVTAGGTELSLKSVTYGQKKAVAVYLLNGASGEIKISNLVISEFTRK